jgi:hypothetical protein
MIALPFRVLLLPRIRKQHRECFLSSTLRRVKIRNTFADAAMFLKRRTKEFGDSHEQNLKEI